MSKSDIKKLLKDIFDKYSFDPGFSHKDDVVLEDDKIYVNEEMQWWYLEGELVPHLKLVQDNNFLKKVTVDIGAIKFIAKGADIFRPGITFFDEDIESGELVAIEEEGHGKILALGIASGTTKEMEEIDGGKVIKTIHYVGDEIWNS